MEVKYLRWSQSSVQFSSFPISTVQLCFHSSDLRGFESSQIHALSLELEGELIYTQFAQLMSLLSFICQLKNLRVFV